MTQRKLFLGCSLVVLGGSAFQLSRGVPYELVVVGNNGNGRYTAGRVRLQL